MSTNADDSDGNTRAPRRSSRRLASTDSLTDLESRVVTPVLQGRSKLDSISENVTTPSKQGRQIIDTPRVPRNQPPLVTASPYRRTTRAMSQEKDITASPLTTTRSRRRSVQAESDDDQKSVDGETPVSVSGARKKRQSMIPTPKVQLIREEEEEDVGSNDKTLVDELELRTRSISKSPSVHGSPPKAVSMKSSLNGSTISTKSDANESGFGALDVSQVSQKQPTFFKNRKQKISESESVLSEEDLREHTKELSPIKKYSSKKRQTLQVTKTDYMEVVDRLTKSAEQTRNDSKVSRVKSNDNSPEQDDDIVESSQPPLSLSNTPIRGRRSIRDGGSSNEEAAVEELLVDFSDTPKTPISSKKMTQSADKSPGSVKKTPKSAVKDIAAQGTPDSIKKTPKSNASPAQAAKTPESVKKTPKPNGTPSQAAKTPESVKKTPKTNATPAQAAKTPGSGKKTPKNNATSYITDMDITSQIVHDDMDITLNGHHKETSNTNKSASPTQLSTPAAKRESLAALVDKMVEASPNINRGRKSTSDINGTTSEVDKPRRSWGQSVQNVAYVLIDKITGSTEKKVITAPESAQRKQISDDESDDEHDKNSFVDDEAEVHSDDSMNESEREYLQQNEVVDDGESLGSQDSNELAETSEEDEENDSFIAEEDVQNEYEMNSEEERIEESPPKRRKSRIIVQSSSEDEEEQAESSEEPQTEETNAEVSKNTGESPKLTPAKAKTPRKSLNSAETEGITTESNGHDDKEMTDPNMAPLNVESKKSKRKRESYLHERENVSSKRAKIDESFADKADDEASGTADHFEEDSSPVKPKKKKSKISTVEPAVDIESVLNKCEQLMEAHNAEKKAKTALKREKKARKLALKKQQEELNSPDSNLSSSNKENSVKKKKKVPKHPKQKSVDEAQEPKEDMATSVLKAQEKAEEKRKIKRAKKLLKKQQGSEKENATEATGTQAEAVPVKAKKIKQSHVSPETSKNDSLNKLVQQDEVMEPEVESKKKKKKAVKEPADVVVEASVETKKAKKRKLQEVVEHEDEDKPQPKKLSILQQIEDRDNFNRGHAVPREPNRNVVQKEQSFPVPLASQKLKKIIPESIAVAKRKKKNKSGNKKVIPEPIMSPPKPVWTSSGIFMEEPKTPYKFTSTEYVPIKSAASSTKYGVVLFDAKKSKKAAQPIQDFRTQSMLRNKNRDGSMKNMRGLLGQRNTN